MGRNLFSHFILIFLCLALLENTNFPQVIINPGSAISVDGAISGNEWKDANSLQVEIQTGWKIQVYFKHDASNLYFAFSNVKNPTDRYPEVLIDADNDKNKAMLDDDWWFHASKQDCEGNGLVNNWASCMPTKPGWSANNFPLDSPGAIEISISMRKIYITSAANKKIGIAFNFMENQTAHTIWPSGADMTSPATWATGIISDGTSSITDEILLPGTIKLYQNYPNPFNPGTTITYELPYSSKIDLRIYNLLGEEVKTLFSGEQTSGIHTIQFQAGNLPSGIYYCRLTNGEQDYTKKLVLAK